jgi:hypothetical protein
MYSSVVISATVPRRQRAAQHGARPAEHPRPASTPYASREPFELSRLATRSARLREVEMGRHKFRPERLGQGDVQRVIGVDDVPWLPHGFEQARPERHPGDHHVAEETKRGGHLVDVQLSGAVRPASSYLM